MKPNEIEQESFRIIESEAGNHGFPQDQWIIVRRMIHATADFDYLSSIRFHPGAIAAGIGAVKSGRMIITDMEMVRSGINKRLLRLIDLVEGNRAHPALIIGLPVGFVNASESKEQLLESRCPYITNRGRKGGPAAAVSAVNALVLGCRHLG